MKSDDIDKINEAYMQIEEGLLDRLRAHVAKGATAVGQAKNIAKGAGVVAAGKLASAAGAPEQGAAVQQQGRDQLKAATQEANAAKKASIKSSLITNISNAVATGFQDMVKLGVMDQETGQAYTNQIIRGVTNYLAKL